MNEQTADFFTGGRVGARVLHPFFTCILFLFCFVFFGGEGIDQLYFIWFGLEEDGDGGSVAHNLPQFLRPLLSELPVSAPVL